MNFRERNPLVWLDEKDLRSVVAGFPPFFNDAVFGIFALSFSRLIPVHHLTACRQRILPGICFFLWSSLAAFREVQELLHLHYVIFDINRYDDRNFSCFVFVGSVLSPCLHLSIVCSRLCGLKALRFGQLGTALVMCFILISYSIVYQEFRGGAMRTSSSSSPLSHFSHPWGCFIGRW